MKLRKTLMAVLVGWMVMASVAVVSADTFDDVTISGMLSDCTDKVTLSGDFDITYTFTIYADLEKTGEIWNNYIVRMRTAEAVSTEYEGYYVYLDVRGDNNGWWAFQDESADIAFTSTEVPADAAAWKAWLDEMRNGAEVEVNIARSGNTITVISTAAGYTFITAASSDDLEDQDLVIYLSGEQCRLTDIELTYNSLGSSSEKTDDTSSGSSTNQATWVTGTMEDQLISTFLDNLTDGTATPIGVKGDFDLTLTFYNVGDLEKSDERWNNFVIMLSDAGYNRMYIRADDYSWIMDCSTAAMYDCYDNESDGSTIDWYTYTDYEGDWSEWLETMSDGCDCTVNLTRRGTQITAVMECGGATFTISADTDIIGEYVDIYLTGEQCALTNISYSIYGDCTSVPSYIDLSTASDAEVILAADSYTYTGNAIEPAVSVSCKERNLEEGTDYIVYYRKNINVGTAVVIVKGIGDYGGYISRTFEIKRMSQKISLSASKVSLAVGQTQSLTVSGANTTISYASSNSSVATISSPGVVTAKKVGTATITVTAAQTGVYSKATATVTISVIPATPVISSIKNTTSGVKVKWGKVTGATKYYVYRKVGSGSYSCVKTITSGNTVSWTDTSVTSGKNYYYKVYAYASTGKSSASSAKSIRYLKAGKISSLTNTSSGITVKWSKVSGASGYYVYRKTGSGSFSKVKTVTSSSTVKYSDTAVKSKNGKTYTYYVVPYYKNKSGTVTKGAYTEKKMVRLTSVSLSSVKNSAEKAITVKISKKNAKATGYQIQYSTSKSFASGNKTVTINKASTLSKKITKLKKGKTYYVRVRAYKTVSGTKYYSAWSSKKSVKISK